MVALCTRTAAHEHMWLSLIYDHLPENNEYEFGCFGTALAQWPTFWLPPKNSPMNPLWCKTIHPDPEFLCPHARTGPRFPAAEDYPRAKQSADRDQLDAVAST